MADKYVGFSESDGDILNIIAYEQGNGAYHFGVGNYEHTDKA